MVVVVFFSLTQKRKVIFTNKRTKREKDISPKANTHFDKRSLEEQGCGCGVFLSNLKEENNFHKQEQ